MEKHCSDDLLEGGVTYWAGISKRDRGQFKGIEYGKNAKSNLFQVAFDIYGIFVTTEGNSCFLYLLYKIVSQILSALINVTKKVN